MISRYIVFQLALVVILALLVDATQADDSAIADELRKELNEERREQVAFAKPVTIPKNAFDDEETDPPPIVDAYVRREASEESPPSRQREQPKKEAGTSKRLWGAPDQDMAGHEGDSSSEEDGNDEKVTTIGVEKAAERLVDKKEMKKEQDAPTESKHVRKIEDQIPVDEGEVKQADDSSIPEKEETSCHDCDHDDNSSERKMKDESKRLWGSTGSAAANTGEPLPENNQQHAKPSNEETEGGNVTSNISGQHPHIPFVSPKSHQNVHHSPPEAFSLAARVYVDPSDGLAHFDYADESETKMKELALPYWDCGVTGSTTSPLRLKDAYFRHAMGTSTSWNGGAENSGDLHPTLVVALSSFLLELNSGNSLEIHTGDVVLLEDAIRPGHRIRPLHPNTKASDIKLLFMTLPQQHYHAGKEHLSLKDATTKFQKDPCPDVPHQNQPHGFDNEPSTDSIAGSLSADILKRSKRAVGSSSPIWDGRRLRLFALGTIGLSLSTLAADFIGRTAPLWLAVGIGGTFFVALGTYGFTIATDNLITAVELWRERKRLDVDNPLKEEGDKIEIDASNSAATKVHLNEDTVAVEI